jgi:hypothetical protein
MKQYRSKACTFILYNGQDCNVVALWRDDGERRLRIVASTSHSLVGRVISLTDNRLRPMAGKNVWRQLREA